MNASHKLHETSLADKYPGCGICKGLAEGAIWPRPKLTDDELQRIWREACIMFGDRSPPPLSTSQIRRIHARASTPRWRRWFRRTAEMEAGA